MRFYSSVAQETTLQADLTAVGTTMQVQATTGFPIQFPYTLIIGKDTIKEEVVDVTAAAGTTLTITRGRDGTVAQDHDFNTTVHHGFSGRDFQDSRDHEADDAAHAGLVPSPHGNAHHDPFFASVADLSAHAALSSTHNATASATADRIVLRDGAGQASVQDPTGPLHIANKQYVDGVFGSVVETTEATIISNVTNTTYNDGGVECSVSFVAPATGKVVVTITADVRVNTVGDAFWLGFQIWPGSVAGTGTIVQATDDNIALRFRTEAAENHNAASYSKLVTGLTAGSTYTVRTMQRVSGGSGQVNYRRILVQP